MATVIVSMWQWGCLVELISLERLDYSHDYDYELLLDGDDYDGDDDGDGDYG